MKKIFTLSLAVCAAASVWASQPDAVVKADTDAQPAPTPLCVAAPVQVANMPMANSMLIGNDTEAAMSRASKLQVMYRVPEGSYFPWMRLTTDTGFSWPLRMSGLLPAYTDIVWDNISNKGRNDDGEIQWQETSMKWMQIDPETNKPATGENAKTFSTDCDYEMQTTQSPYDDYGMYAPYLRFGAYGYFSNWTDNDEKENAMFYQMGGSSLPNDETLQSWQEAFPLGVEPFGGLPVNIYSAEFHRTMWVSSFDFVDYEDSFDVAVESFDSTMTDAQMKGFAQRFTVPSPMILRSIKGMCLLRSDAPLHLEMDLLDAETYEVFATSSCDLPAMPGDESTGDWTAYDFPFTSIQGIDEVDYIPVNKNFVAVLRGFQGAEGIIGGAPVVLGFKYKQKDSATGENVSLYNVNPMQEMTGYWTTGKIAGEDFQGMVRVPYMFSADNDDIWALAISFLMCADMDLPYLQASEMTKKVNGNWGEWEDCEIEETHEVVLNQPNDKLFYEYKVGCPALLDEVSITCNGDELPEWLSLWAENGQELEVEQNGSEYELGQKYFYMGIGLADGMETAPENIDVDVEYMGCKQTFHIVAEQGGVDNITADNAAEVVATKYFDLQGRSLVGEPAQGLYIRQDMMSNGTVRNSKMVK